MKLLKLYVCCGSCKDLKCTSLIFQVFARTTPAQKALVIEAFAKQGLTTVMCGDGTNDVGALQVMLTAEI